jgi:hypothetical protein
MKKLLCGGVLVTVLSLLAFASAGAAPEHWKVIARASDGGDQVAIVAVAKRRVTQLAIRAKVTGSSKTAKLHTVVTCSKATSLGIVTLSRAQKFTLTGPEMKVLQLPMQFPENCGVTAIGTSNSILRVVGKTTYLGRLTLQILVPCVVQTFSAARGKCL